MPDPSRTFQSSGMVESKSVGTFSPLQRQESQKGLFVDRGVGSPRPVKSSSSNIFSADTKVCINDFHFCLLFKFIACQITYHTVRLFTNNCFAPLPFY